MLPGDPRGWPSPPAVPPTRREADPLLACTAQEGARRGVRAQSRGHGRRGRSYRPRSPDPSAPGGRNPSPKPTGRVHVGPRVRDRLGRPSRGRGRSAGPGKETTACRSTATTKTHTQGARESRRGGGHVGACTAASVPGSRAPSSRTPKLPAFLCCKLLSFCTSNNVHHSQPRWANGAHMGAPA